MRLLLFYDKDMNNCSCKKATCGCDPCKQNTCCEPFLDIDEMPDSVSTLRYNINGLTAWYDYGNMIYQTQTDTRLSADVLKRVLIYMAERHTDSISAKELGSILHIADIGDVDISEVTDNSLFVYKKDNDCAHGCEGINNRWVAWNASDYPTDSVKTLMGFNDDDAPRALLPPANTNQYYDLGWTPNNKVGYHQPQERSMRDIAISENGKYYAYQRYIDPTTKEEVYVKVEVQV